MAALYFADLDPTLITFGQMAAIDKPCNLINSDRFYRFENSRSGYFGPTYDPIPNLPYFASHFGRQIMLGDDSTGVAYIGKDDHVHFRPYDTDQAFRTHRLIPEDVGYVHRIENLAANYEPNIQPTTINLNDTVTPFDCFVEVKNDTEALADIGVSLEEEEAGEEGNGGKGDDQLDANETISTEEKQSNNATNTSGATGSSNKTLISLIMPGFAGNESSMFRSVINDESNPMEETNSNLTIDLNATASKIVDTIKDSTATIKVPQLPAMPKFVVRSTGFVTGSRCSNDLECISRNCKRKQCRSRE